MTQIEIIEILKAQYSRDIRKQIVKSILQHEKNHDIEAKDTSYKILNQIFSYVIAQLQWKIPENSNEWDNAPLQIMLEVFPKLETSVWYHKQQLNTPNTLKDKLT